MNSGKSISFQKINFEASLLDRIIVDNFSVMFIDFGHYRNGNKKCAQMKK